MTDQIEKPTNPLLANLRIPGETFRLPSHGLFYVDGELDDNVKNGEVHVYPMTSLDEIVFKTPDMLFTGEALRQVFARCIPQVKKPTELLAKDVDFLLTCLRMITYGSEITLLYTHNCENAKSREYDVPLRPIIQEAKAIDPTTITSTFTVRLENGQTVKLKPSTFATMLEFSQAFDVGNKMPSLEELQKSVVNVLVDIIASVDDVTDKALIREWATKIPAGWVRQLTAAIEQVGNWGATFETHQNCKDCGQLITIEFNTNPVSFFS